MVPVPLVSLSLNRPIILDGVILLGQLLDKIYRRVGMEQLDDFIEKRTLSDGDHRDLDQARLDYGGTRLIVLWGRENRNRLWRRWWGIDVLHLMQRLRNFMENMQ